VPARRRPPPTPALDALSGTEHARILAELLTSHPELESEAEDAARRLLDDASVDAIAESVAWALEELPLDALAMRSGRIRGRGYVHETEAAWEILEEAVEPFLADMRRRASLGLGAAVDVTAGIVAGLYRCREPEDGTVVAYAGPDSLSELAAEVINEANRLGLVLSPDVADQLWPDWSPSA
jgi:hypothetical protein